MDPTSQRRSVDEKRGQSMEEELRTSPNFNFQNIYENQQMNEKRQLNISQEERKKMLLNDDNEFEDQDLYDKIDRIKAELHSQKQEDLPSKEQHDPVDSAVTFNEKGEENLVDRGSKDENEIRRGAGSRLSDVVNFDDKSNEAINKSNIDDENPLTDDHMSKTPDDSPLINAQADRFHHNEESYEDTQHQEQEKEKEKDEIDIDNEEIENKLKMIQDKIIQITEEKKEYQLKQEKPMSSSFKATVQPNNISKSQEQQVDPGTQQEKSLEHSKGRNHKQWNKVK